MTVAVSGLPPTLVQRALVHPLCFKLSLELGLLLANHVEQEFPQAGEFSQGAVGAAGSAPGSEQQSSTQGSRSSLEQQPGCCFQQLLMGSC